MTLHHTLPYALGAILLAWGGFGATPHAPSLDSSADRDSLRQYVEQIRAATERFRDHDAAIAAGYRWMGPDMPNMGEHWIQPHLVMQRPFDPMRPSCLSYLRRGEKRILTGVAYILPVRPGEQPPELPTGGPWHFHMSTLDDEAFGHQPYHHEMKANTVRLAMLHAWVWAENPDGVFTADNWALSYLRHELPVPSPVDPQAAKALFLLADEGVEYFRNVVTTNADPTPEDLRTIRAVLTRARSQVESALQSTAEGTAPATSELIAIWQAAWHAVQGTVQPSLWTAIRPIMLESAH